MCLGKGEPCRKIIHAHQTPNHSHSAPSSQTKATVCVRAICRAQRKTTSYKMRKEEKGKQETERKRVKWSHKSKRTLREKEGQRGADLLVTNRQINKIRRPICIQKKKYFTNGNRSMLN